MVGSPSREFYGSNHNGVEICDLTVGVMCLEVGEDASQMMVTEEPKPVLDEVCLVSVPSLVITVEAGVGTKTLPMLLLESNLQANVRNWSSSVSFNQNVILLKINIIT